MIRFLDHTADIKFEVAADSLPAAFCQSARAVTLVMCEEDIAEELEISIDVSGDSLEALLFAFLDEIILLLDTRSLFVSSCDLEVDEKECTIKGVVKGDNAAKYERHGDVKAPTYHDMLVEQKDGVWTLRATLDI